MTRAQKRRIRQARKLDRYTAGQIKINLKLFHKALKAQIQPFIDNLSELDMSNIEGYVDEWISEEPIYKAFLKVGKTTGVQSAELAQDYLHSQKRWSRRIKIKSDLSDKWTDRISRFINKECYNHIGNISETTRKHIIKSVTKGISEGNELGLSIWDIQYKIRDNLEAILNTKIGKARALNIARTETMRMHSFAYRHSSISTGLDLKKYWMHSRNKNERPHHMQAMEETKHGIPVNQPIECIPSGKIHPHDGIGGAAEDCNCRCTEILEPTEDL